MSITPGVNKLNGYRIERATIPITITGLESGTTYYFVLTVITESGEGQESKEIAYTAGQSEDKSIVLDLKVKETAPESQSSQTNNKVEPDNTAVKRQQTRDPNLSDKLKTEKTDQQPSVSDSKADGENNIRGAPSGNMTVAWDNVPNAINYNIYWRTKPGVTKQNGIQIKSVTSPYTFIGLNRGATYYFVVTAVSQTGESQESAELSFTVPK